MISFEKVKKYCNEDISLIENYEKAINDKVQTWDCHHRREIEASRKELIKKNQYYNRPAEELVFLTKSEHTTLHMNGIYLLEETRRKMSEAQKGKHHNEASKRKMSIAKQGNKYRLGKLHSEEARRKMSEAHKGKTPWNKGKKCKPLTEEHKQKVSDVMKGNKNRIGAHHTEEAKLKISFTKKGCCWFNNGIKNVFVKECPEGFVRGRLKKKSV